MCSDKNAIRDFVGSIVVNEKYSAKNAVILSLQMLLGNVKYDYICILQSQNQLGHITILRKFKFTSLKGTHFEVTRMYKRIPQLPVPKQVSNKP